MSANEQPAPRFRSGSCDHCASGRLPHLGRRYHLLDGAGVVRQRLRARPGRQCRRHEPFPSGRTVRVGARPLRRLGPLRRLRHGTVDQQGAEPGHGQQGQSRDQGVRRRQYQRLAQRCRRQEHRVRARIPSAEGYRIAGEDLGGNYARRVLYKPLSGRVFVKRLDSMAGARVVREELELAGRQIAAPPPTDDIELF